MDIAVTAWYSPNLAGEGNPLVFIFGRSWLGLIESTIAILAGISMCLYYDLFLIKQRIRKSLGCLSGSLLTFIGWAIRGFS